MAMLLPGDNQATASNLILRVIVLLKEKTQIS